MLRSSLATAWELSKTFSRWGGRWGGGSVGAGIEDVLAVVEREW